MGLYKPVLVNKGVNVDKEPTPNTIPVSKNDGKLDLGWIPQGPQSGLNADKVDGYHASTVSAPNVIPITGIDGKIPSEFLPGSLTVENADTVDGFHASQVPAPNKIPVAREDGKLDPNWLPFQVTKVFEESYARVLVGPTLPSAPVHNLLFYNTTNNTLQRYDGETNSWVPINWRRIVEASPEWRAGRLRINTLTNRLEISPNGTDWYPCIPAVGSPAIELLSIDNSTYTLLYWIAPGQTVIIRNANHIPIVYARDVVPFFSGSYFHVFSYEWWVGLRPSGIAITNGDGQLLWGDGTTPGSRRNSNLSIVPIAEQSTQNINWADFNLRIFSDGRFFVTSMCLATSTYFVGCALSSGTASVTSYWLGAWFTQEGQQFVVGHLTLTRRA